MGFFDDKDASTIVFEYVFPWVGVVIGNMMYAAPWKDVLDASLTGDLGVLNPLPWAFMTGNCFGWLVYGMLKNNLSIVSGSAPGLLLSIWLNLQAVKLQYARSYSTAMRKILLQTSLEGETVEFVRQSIGSNIVGQQQPHLETDDALTDIDEEEERSGTNSEESIDLELVEKMPLHLQHQQLSPQQRRSKPNYQHPEQPLQYTNDDDHQRTRQQQQQQQQHYQDDDVVRISITPQQAAQQLSQSQLSGQHRHSQVIRVDQNHTKGNGPHGIGDFDLLVLNVHSSMSKIRTTATQETVLLIVCAIWVSIILILSFTPGVTSADSTTVVGIAVNLNLVIFYGSPLSTIYTVFKTGVSETIHVPTMILNSFNGGLWGVFGLVTGDPYVTLPNSVGFFLGVVQMFLCILYPREKRETVVTESGEVIESISQRHRRTVVMLSSQNLNDMESLSVLSLVHPSKHSRRGVRIYNNNSLSNIGFDFSGRSNRYAAGNNSANTTTFNEFVLPSDYSRSTRRKMQAQNQQKINNNSNDNNSDSNWGHESIQSTVMVGGSSGQYRNQVSDFLDDLGARTSSGSGGTSTTAEDTTDSQKVDRLWL